MASADDPPDMHLVQLLVDGEELYVDPCAIHANISSARMVTGLNPDGSTTARHLVKFEFETLSPYPAFGDGHPPEEQP